MKTQLSKTIKQDLSTYRHLIICYNMSRSFCIPAQVKPFYKTEGDAKNEQDEKYVRKVRRCLDQTGRQCQRCTLHDLSQQIGTQSEPVGLSKPPRQTGKKVSSSPSENQTIVFNKYLRTQRGVF